MGTPLLKKLNDGSMTELLQTKALAGAANAAPSITPLASPALASAPFFTALVNYTEKRADSWHCPGHSAGAAFLKAPVGRRFHDFFGENLLRADICNAVEEMGQLLDHTGAAYEAEKNAAEIFGADHLFFVTNGTSTSNKIVWHSQVGPDDVVVVDRNCHKSVLHAIMMTGATPIYLMPTRNHHGLIGPIPADEFGFESIRRKIEAHPFVKNKKRKPRILTLTQSTYDGILYNTREIKKRLDGRIDALHFDEAWLPHATFHPLYDGMHAIEAKARTRRSLVFATQSTHKTLAGLSQASQVLVQNAEERALNRTLFNEAYLMHTSTSPQYSIIASCDVAAAMMANGHGRTIVQGALDEAEAFRAEMAARRSRDASWGFSVWGPDRARTTGDSGATCGDDPAAWNLLPNEAWHGFGAVEEGFNRLDPLKVTVLTPGLDMNGVFSATGVPAAIVAKYLCENGVIVEKCGLYSFFIMFTIGITQGRWNTLLQALEKFNRDLAANAAIGEVMPAFARAHPVHAATGLRDLCSRIHAMYKAHDIARMTTAMYTSEMTPAMKPSDAFAKMAHEEIERVEIDELEGKITAVLLTPYPPGIPLLVPGERFNTSIVDYLRFARSFSDAFPGFETDVHGLVRTNVDGTTRYFVDCVKMPAPRASGRKRTARDRVGA